MYEDTKDQHFEKRLLDETIEAIEYNRKIDWFNNELNKLKEMEKNLSK